MKKIKKILVTGGLGYIGSHSVVSLIEDGYEVVIVDNLSNTNISVLDKINKITKSAVNFLELDIRDKDSLKTIFKENNFDAVMHFAGLKSVEQSVKNPNLYYENNVVGSRNLLEVMIQNDVDNFIFSSSATVYGEPSELPIKETHKLNPVNPYGKSKLSIENMCQEIVKEYSNFSCIALRYFNPIGAHKSGLIGENPKNKPNNLVPYLCMEASKPHGMIVIYGDDYLTIDGTGVRDYIHVMDIASGHTSAMKYIRNFSGFIAINLGTGKGFSVKQLINEFEKVNKIKINSIVGAKRDGDVAEIFADAGVASKILQWKVSFSLTEMLQDAWRWEKTLKRP